MVVTSIIDTSRKLEAIITRVTAGAGSIASGSREFNATAQTLSEGASEQAATAEQVSSSIEEMKSCIAQNAASDLG